jgi:hypothetical protein
MTSLTEIAVPPGGRKLPDGTSITPEGLHVSRTGAVMGRPEAEHSQYGLVRDDDSKAHKLTEPQIRGIEGCVDERPQR